MDKFKVRYATYSKAIPPQSIRIKTPGWAGMPDKMEDGSAGQPWHCLPFVEAATFGLELIYPFETECQVVNDNGLVRFDWDFAKEPGQELTGGEFATFFPKEASKFYLFTTRIDVQAPDGYVVRTEPHPRFFTDDTGTVPIAITGHLQTQWWPRKLFVVFKVPPPGQRHIFRKGEAYAQIIFVPRRMNYELEKLSPEEEAHRRKLDTDIVTAHLQIADNVWHNSSGYQLSNHYKMLAGAFQKEGQAGVEEMIKKAMEHHAATLPSNKSVAEYLALGSERLKENNFDQAHEIYTHVLSLEPNNAEALSHLGICVACKGLPVPGLKLMAQAVALRPDSAVYHANMGELLRMMGKLSEAEASLRAAARLAPDDPGYISVLGLTLAQQGKVEEGLRLCRHAVAATANSAVAHLRLGLVLAHQRQFAEARSSYETALKLEPGLPAAQDALRALRTVP